MATRDATEVSTMERVVVLANRVAILTFATAFSVVAALVALPHVVAGTAGALARVITAIPLLLAVFAFAATWHARTALKRARDQHDRARRDQDGVATAGADDRRRSARVGA